MAVLVGSSRYDRRQQDYCGSLPLYSFCTAAPRIGAWHLCVGPGNWVKNEPLSLPETVCREKLRGSWVTVKDPKSGRQVERIAERLLTADDIKAALILAGRALKDVCAPFLEPRPWSSRLPSGGEVALVTAWFAWGGDSVVTEYCPAFPDHCRFRSPPSRTRSLGGNFRWPARRALPPQPSR